MDHKQKTELCPLKFLWVKAELQTDRAFIIKDEAVVRDGSCI